MAREKKVEDSETGRRELVVRGGARCGEGVINANIQ